MAFTFHPAENLFSKRYKEGQSQVLWVETTADLETPVSAFLKLAKDQPYSFLLESVEGGATLGRYSFIGCDPDLIWMCQQNTASISFKNGDQYSDVQTVDQPPLEHLREILDQDIHIPDHLPPSCVGLFGYLGYDMVRHIEEIPNQNSDPLGIPDSIMVRPQIIVIFDNIKHTMSFATPIWHDKDTSATDAYHQGLSRLNQYINRLKNPIVSKEENTKNATLKTTSNFSTEAFYQAVETAKEYIYAGDIFQVVLSQRFETEFPKDAFSLYRSLRRLNPSPFLFYLNMKDFQLVGSSPEILVRVRDNNITIRPIAGTRKRGTTPEEDRALEAELLADPKERAEHLMLLDLGRNDVGKTAEIGSVHVTAQYTVEHYSHVMHIVSNVEGTLKNDCDALDALFAGFPAGTVSGAPKKRAMEIIDELEPHQRKFYAGCIGYLGFDGSVDSCIALRTGLVKDNKLYIQAGGGIVSDSTAEGEYEESINKAKALITAAQDSLSEDTLL